MPISDYQTLLRPVLEQVIVRRLVAMSHRGALQDAGKAIGLTGDEGIDDIINEDHLSLDVVYVQAKFWTATIAHPDMQHFAGALAGKKPFTFPFPYATHPIG